jgi:hypothetical protein
LYSRDLKGFFRIFRNCRNNKKYCQSTTMKIILAGLEYD